MIEKNTLLMQQKYIDYINNHVNNVLRSYITLITEENLNKLYEADVFKPMDIIFSRENQVKVTNSLARQVLTHDQSKFSDEEFEPYRKKYYPYDAKDATKKSEEELEEIEQEFQGAWKHHYMNNRHHPEYWRYHIIEKTPNGNKIKLVENRLDTATIMPVVDVLHMILDWNAMSMQFGNTVFEWWNNNATDEKEALNPITIEVINNIIQCWKI